MLKGGVGTVLHHAKNIPFHCPETSPVFQLTPSRLKLTLGLLKHVLKRN